MRIFKADGPGLGIALSQRVCFILAGGARKNERGL